MKSGKRLCIVFSVFLVSFLWIGTALFAAEKEVKIGVLYPLSGAQATIGRDLQRAAELMADIINTKTPGVDIPMAQWGGIPNLGGAKIKLIFVDHRGEPDRGADLAKRLILDDKVAGLMGAYQSAVSKTVSAVAERYGIPMINDSSTSPDLTKRGLKWFWRTTPHDDYFNKDLFELLKGLAEGKVKGVKKPVPKDQLKNLVYACENTEWGSGVAKSIEGYAKEYGFNITRGILYNSNSPDLSSEAKSLVSAKPGAMLFASYLSDSLLMIRTLKGMKAAPKVLWGQDAGFEMADFPKQLGADTNGVLTRTVFIDKLVKVKKVAGQINALYKEKYGDNLTGATARSVVGVQAWASVLNKAGSTDPKAIQKACNEINIPGNELVMPWAGIKFDATGQNVLGRGLIGQYQKTKDGKIELEIVYPFDLATANFIYPFPGWK